MNRTSIEWTDYTTNLIRYRDPGSGLLHLANSNNNARYVAVRAEE